MGHALLMTVLFSFVASAGGETLAEKLGYDSDDILLILHADDVGMSHSVNKATIQAFEVGMVTSGSIMVPCPWFPEIAAYCREHPEADLAMQLRVPDEGGGQPVWTVVGSVAGTETTFTVMMNATDGALVER